MAILPILEIPHPILRRKARKVRAIDSALLKLAYDMIDTMRDAGGVGLAANQVGSLSRVIVIQLPCEDEARIYFNPEIVHREGERKVEEGCLSIPGYRGNITRSIWIKFRGMDSLSNMVRFKSNEMLSQALEHEVDHLNGILYSDHLKDHEKLFAIDVDGEKSSGKDSLVNHADRACEPKDDITSRIHSNINNGEPETDIHDIPASLKVK